VNLGYTVDSDSSSTGDPGVWWAPGDSVSTVHNINGACIPALPSLGSCLSAGQSYLLGTLTFHKTVGADGFEIVPLVSRTDNGWGTDDVLNLYGEVISDTTTFNSAYMVKSGVEKGLSLRDRAGEPRRCDKLKGLESGARSQR